MSEFNEITEAVEIVAESKTGMIVALSLAAIGIGYGAAVLTKKLLRRSESKKGA